MKNQSFLKVILACYFVVNLVARWEIVFSVNQWLTVVVGVASCLLFFSITVFPRYLTYPLCVFAFSFPLYGAPGALYTRGHVFEFLLCVQSLALLVVAVRSNLKMIENRMVSNVLMLYLFYSFLSILLFPASEYEFLLQPRLFLDGLKNVLYENSWTPLYSIAGMNRLGLFIFSTVLIACQENAVRVFKAIFVCMLIAGVISAALGIAHQLGVPLAFVKSQYMGRLQSVFAHPNVFAVYITITTPFVFYIFGQDNSNRKWKVLSSSVIIVCATALIFSLCRASWLVYPLTIFVGSLCLHWQKKGGLKWKLEGRLPRKAIIFFSLTFLLGVFLVFFFPNLKTTGERDGTASSQISRIDTSTITERFSNILNPTVRARVFHDSLPLIREAPVFGLGFESYGWHTSVLAQIPQSGFSRNRKDQLLRGSTHNLYLTHLVNGGIVGLVLWLTLIGVACSFLISDLLVNKSTDSFPVLLCIVAFHLYGMAESMTFTPIIWFIIFLYIGYAATIDENVLPARLYIFWKRWTVVCTILVLSGGVAYATNFQSWKLAEKYGLPRYYAPNNMDQIYYSGFYTPARKRPVGKVRWMGKRGSVEIVKSGIMEFLIFYEYPVVLDEPVIVTIDVDGDVIDEVVFFKSKVIKRQYYFSESSVGRRLNLTVSRTWNPQKFGVKWGRIIGAAITAPRYFSKIPEDGIGFLSPWKRMTGQVPEWVQPGQQYRWTGKRATIRVDDTMQKQGFKIYLRSRHPDVTQKPVEVQIFADEDLVHTVILSSSNWQPLSIGREKLVGKKALTFHVSRTWNPRLLGNSKDNRNLGIIVALP